jgi:hypothetical protein
MRIARSRLFAWSLLLLTVPTLATAQPSGIRSRETWALARERVRATISAHGDSIRYPRSTQPDGSWRTVPPRDWTSGFFPGILWMVYERTGEKFCADAADRYTRGLESISRFGGTHDLGFMIFNSYGQGYRIRPTDEYRAVILRAARTLATRFNTRVGCIKSWDNPQWQFPVIIDNMMNLELLFWAAANGGGTDLREIAIRHAEVTMKNHVRADGSTFHVVGYDTTDGRILVRNTHQGFADSSTWSRGQAWGIYGFTMTYRYTRDERFLAAARKLADYFLANLPADHIPYWDFDAPGIPREPRDASAAAIAAAGLIELSAFPHAGDSGERYLRGAKAILATLTSPPYLAERDSTLGILNHSVTSKPTETEVDVDLIYGDYYLLESLRRLEAPVAGGS